jgi:hypothetical protein
VAVPLLVVVPVGLAVLVLVVVVVVLEGVVVEGVVDVWPWPPAPVAAAWAAW